jgi:hypothetical protein
MADADDTRVARVRRPSDTILRATSEIMPRIAAAMDVPDGPEREDALAGAFGAAIDLISGRAREVTAEVERLRGALANAEQSRDLLRAENARLREELRIARGGR